MSRRRALASALLTLRNLRMGVPDNPALPASDEGAQNTFAFRTASLRNLTFTAPYMHSGIFRTLGDVLGFYEDVDSRTRLSPCRASGGTKSDCRRSVTQAAPG